MSRIVLGVVGKMASGKNYVSSVLEEMEFLSIDADLCVHKAIEQSKEQILEAFLPFAKEKQIELQNVDGTINRKNLGKLLFSDKKLLQKQESIIHPQINLIFEDFIAQNPTKNIVLNATLLYKTPVVKKCDALVFVKAPAILRFLRAKKRDNLSSKQIFLRFWSQIKIFAKYKKLNSDIYSIWNLGNAENLKKQLQKILNSITNRN